MSAASDCAIYIHWPFCKAKCPYCDFNSHVREQVDEDVWEQSLLTELTYGLNRLGKRRLASVFFGGGTPSLMPPRTVEALLGAIDRAWGISPETEITLEANPTSYEAAKFKAFRAAGVNRVSLGVQALEQEALTFLGRQHSVAEALAALEHCGRTFERFSFDVIYARPGQSVAAWEAELKQALTLAGRHLSLYQLTIEEGTQFYHRYHAGGFALPEEEDAAAMYQLTEALIAERGLQAYEVSNYAAPGQESQHNLVYWRYGDYLGIGPGAHGRITSYDGVKTATVATRSPEAWIKNVQQVGHGWESEFPLDDVIQTEECVMMGLRLAEGLPLARVEKLAQKPWSDVLDAQKIADYSQQGLLTMQDGILRATPAGRLVLTRLTGELLV